MNHKERIPIFIKLVNWSKLLQRWGNPITENELHNLYDLNKIIKYWKQYPELRIGQMLINLGVIDIKDQYKQNKIWYDNEQSILLDQGINPIDFLLWTSLFDKEGNRLKSPKTQLLKDLSTDHLQNIMIKLKIPTLYKKTIIKELVDRKKNSV